MPHRWSRRQIVQGTVGLGLLAGCGRWPGQAQAQPPVNVHRLGWLMADGAPHEEIRQALGELGYVEGQQIVIEFRSAEGHDERLPALAAELVRLPVDLLLVEGDPAAQAARQATQNIPIVLAAVGDPVATGLVSSLARPGGNVTGVTNATHQLTGKRLQLLQEVQPALARVGVLWSVDNAGNALGWRQAQEATRALGLEMLSLALRGPEDFDTAFATVTREHAEALFVLNSLLVIANRQRIIDFSARSGRLGMYPSRGFVQDGGLMAYSANSLSLRRRAAAHVDKILHGAKPADLPVEQPTTFDFIINLKTARALGLTIPQHVLLQATEVIQ
jgi:putative tryptophan/tyrosine transport system substrate-binding protein